MGGQSDVSAGAAKERAFAAYQQLRANRKRAIAKIATVVPPVIRAAQLRPRIKPLGDVGTCLIYYDCNIVSLSD